MKSITSYQERAIKCRALARQAKSAEDRELLLKIAETWDWIARDNGPAGGNEREVAAVSRWKPRHSEPKN